MYRQKFFEFYRESNNTKIRRYTATPGVNTPSFEVVSLDGKRVVKINKSGFYHINVFDKPCIIRIGD